VAHKCCCGCGNEVITPLSPTGWKLVFDGQSISLVPSIGNWSFACQSHYFIRENKVIWAARWSKEEIDAGREHDALTKKKYFNSRKVSPNNDKFLCIRGREEGESKKSFWQTLRRLFLKLPKNT